MKYELTEETKYGLYRIEALKDFGNVKKGDKGGWIEKEANLSQDGDCWVYGDAEVYEGKYNTGYIFAYKADDWNVTEVPVDDGVLWIKDYKPVEEEPEEITLNGKKYRLIED